MNMYAFSLALLPFLFAAWVLADPLNAIEQIKELRRKHTLNQARKLITRKVNLEYSRFRAEAIKNGSPAKLIDKLQTHHKQKLIDELTQKLYVRWISEYENA